MFYEHPRRGWALISWVIYIATTACAYASAAGFLLVLVGNLIVEEVFGFEFTQADDLWRLEIGVSALAFSAFLGIAVVFHSIARLAYVRQLARIAQTDEGRMRIPGPRAQKMLAKTSPFSGFYILAAYFLLFGIGGAIIGALALPETMRSNPESARDGQTVLLVIVATVVALVLLVIAAWQLWTPQWRLAATQCSLVWTPALRLTAKKRARNRLPSGALRGDPSSNRIGRVVGISLAISGAMFLAGAYMRKPGRLADIRRFDPPGETAIAVLVGVSGIITLLCLSALLLLALARLLRQIDALNRLHAIAEGRLIVTGMGSEERKKTRQTAAQRYEDLLSSPWPLQSIGAVLVALGWANAPLVYFTEQILPGSWPSWLLATQLIIGAVGAILIALSDNSGARFRNVLRAAWG